MKPGVGFQLVAVWLAFAACGGGGSDDQTTEAARVVQLSASDTVALQAALEERVQEAITECMREAGFAYEVYAPPTPVAETKGLDDVATAQRIGYGLSDLAASQFAKAYDPRDPNVAVRQRLTAEQRAAYDARLFGEGGDGGCRTTSQATVLAEYRDVQVLVDKVEEAMSSDPDLREAERRWERCMADAGFEARGRSWGYDTVTERLSQLQLTAVAPDASGQLRPVSEFVTTLPSGPVQYDSASLAEIRRFEIAVATADARCTGKVEPLTRPRLGEVADRVARENPEAVRQLGALLSGA
jgi:hypothetical protein